MTVTDPRPRDTAADPLFVNRWSTRRYINEPIPKPHLESFFEAARWAPSCFNEQPWVFVYAIKNDDRQKLLSILTEKNQEWAKNAPIIGVIFCRRHFEKNGKENLWAKFDTGAAWISLALQAEKLGYSAHGMGGFSVEKAHEVLKVPTDKYEAIAAFTIGKVDPDTDEQKTSRKSIESFVFEGNLK